MKFKLWAFLATAALIPGLSMGSDSLYVSYSPDIRYSKNGRDGRIALLPEKGLYGYGHEIEYLKPCSTESKDCLVFGFMAVAAVPPEAKPGEIFSDGEFKFEVAAPVTFSLLGIQETAHLVSVRKNGELANRYYFSAKRGVIAIVVLNFENDNIPESTFFLTSNQGIFGVPERPE